MFNRTEKVSRETLDMGNKLHQLDKAELQHQLKEIWKTVSTSGTPSSGLEKQAPSTLSSQQPLGPDDFEVRWVEKLWIHYSEVCKWNPRLSLIGPGTGAEIVERHYGESLAGLGFLSKADRTVIDIGSGGGFPGWVLAAVLPKVQFRLIEPREKKWVFLQTCIRKAALLSCEAVNARVEAPLPSALDLPKSIDVVTSRALALPAEILEVIAAHSPGLRFLFWVGKEEIALPTGYRVCRSQPLSDSRYRRIVELVPT